MMSASSDGVRGHQRFDKGRLRVDLGQRLDDGPEHLLGDCQHDLVLGSDGALDLVGRNAGGLGDLRH